MSTKQPDTDTYTRLSKVFVNLGGANNSPYVTYVNDYNFQFKLP